MVKVKVKVEVEVEVKVKVNFASSHCRTIPGTPKTAQGFPRWEFTTRQYTARPIIDPARRQGGPHPRQTERPGGSVLLRHLHQSGGGFRLASTTGTGLIDGVCYKPNQSPRHSRRQRRLTHLLLADQVDAAGDDDGTTQQGGGVRCGVPDEPVQTNTPG